LEAQTTDIFSIPEMEGAVDFQIIYPEGVMEALDEHAEVVLEVLKRFPDINCVSGFDKLSPESRLLDEDDRDFFTGDIPCNIPSFNLRRHPRDCMARVGPS